MFWVGVLCCWVVMSFLLLIADCMDWIAIWSTPFGIILCFWALVVTFPFYLGYVFLVRPWRNVWKSVEPERFDKILSFGFGVKFIRLLPRLYICFDRKAAPANKIFFMRVRKQ